MWHLNEYSFAWIRSLDNVLIFLQITYQAIDPKHVVAPVSNHENLFTLVYGFHTQLQRHAIMLFDSKAMAHNSDANRGMLVVPC